MNQMNRGLNAATKRWGSINQEQLQTFILNLRKIAGNLETMCPQLPSSRGVMIDGATKGTRALTLLEEYVTVVNEAVTN